MVVVPLLLQHFRQSKYWSNHIFWDFGDNLTSTIENPAHVYTTPGYYDVSLIANDNYGCSDTLTINNLVYIPGPILDFSINQNLDVIHYRFLFQTTLLTQLIIYIILEMGHVNT